MAKTLTLAGVNFLPQYKTSSAHIREIVQNKSNVMNMKIIVRPGQNSPQEGSELVFKDDSRFLFAGFVTKVTPEETGEGQLFSYNIETSDYSFIFGQKIARRAYQNQTLNYIVTDLMNEYIGASYGFDLTNVATGPTIDSVVFDHISVRKCFEKLQKLTGYIWYVDYEKRLFFTTQSATPAPETITDTTENFQSINIDLDTTQVKNSVIVIGSPDGQQSETYTEETFVGDDTQRSWELQSAPSEIVFIKKNGVEQQYSLDANERSDDVFVYSFSGKSFRVTQNQATYTPSDTVVIRYYPRVPIIVRKIDQNSIDFFAALDGGDGIYEVTLKEPSIITKDEALERAQTELDEYSFPLVIGRFNTRTGLLSGGSIFSPGQVVTVNLPTYGITTDTGFLVQEVNIRLSENASETEYLYEVRFGGKLVGVQEFLENLAADSGADDTTGPDGILTLESAADEFEAEDSVPTHSNTIPPYEYGPAGTPQGKWNLSEWS